MSAGLPLALLLCAAAAAAAQGGDVAVATTPAAATSTSASASSFSEERLPDVQAEGVDAVRAWAQARVSRAEGLFRASGLPREASPASWAGVVIYQIMVDRFNNGDASNDELNLLATEREARRSGDYSDMPNWRHGGDMKGIMDRMGYLVDMGVQALWVTPVLMNSGGYHGYCTTDLTTTDPSFGSPEELRQLVAEAHRHGIYVVLDVVVNHMCDTETHYARKPDHEACAEQWNDVYWKGGASNFTGVAMNFSSNFFPPFRTEAFFNRCGANSVEDTAGETAAAVFGDFVDGMFDYNTQNHDFQEIFTDLLKYWVAYADLDGLRLDAAKHITKDFTAYLSTEMRAYTRSIGKTNFLVIGEEAATDVDWKALGLGRMFSDPRDPKIHAEGKVPLALTERMEDLESTYLANPDFPAPGESSLYNFKMSEITQQALRCDGRPMTDAEAYFGSYNQTTLLAQSLPQPGAEPDAQLWTCVEIHDWPRFLGMSPNNEDLLRVAVTWLLTAPGAPILYYGVEQGYNGNCPPSISPDITVGREGIEEICALHSTEKWGSHPDSLKRQDMFASGPWRLESAVKQVNETAALTKFRPVVDTPWQEDEMLPRNHSMYRHVQRMVALRRSSASLTGGKTVMHEAADIACGFLAFSRLPADGSMAGEVIVLLNPGGAGALQLGSLQLHGPARLPGSRFVSVEDPSQAATVAVAADGTQSLVLNTTLAAGAFLVLAEEGQLQPFNSTLGIALFGGSEARAAGSKSLRR